MEKEVNIEAKGHKLAAEYSKVKSQAAVLKKAVLDEQSRNAELTELVKKHEQTIRKRDQEVESLVFRNEQLTKRIMVLQQDLQETHNNKKWKTKAEVSTHNEIDVLNEELQKKIIENVQLFNTVAEKDLDILNYKEKIQNLEESVSNLQKTYELNDAYFKQERQKYETELSKLKNLVERSGDDSMKYPVKSNTDVNMDESVVFWKKETERWKAECDLLKSKPDSSDKLIQYYESQLSKILETNTLLQSEIRTLWAENVSLKSRLEHITSEHCTLKDNMKARYEELVTSNTNYKSQLDAMTEHLAVQNEKIADQCDEIQVLKHKLSLKNK